MPPPRIRRHPAQHYPAPHAKHTRATPLPVSPQNGASGTARLLPSSHLAPRLEASKRSAGAVAARDAGKYSWGLPPLRVLLIGPGCTEPVRLDSGHCQGWSSRSCFVKQVPVLHHSAFLPHVQSKAAVSSKQLSLVLSLRAPSEVPLQPIGSRCRQRKGL